MPESISLAAGTEPDYKFVPQEKEDAWFLVRLLYTLFRRQGQQKEEAEDNAIGLFKILQWLTWLARASRPPRRRRS